MGQIMPTPLEGSRAGGADPSYPWAPGPENGWTIRSKTLATIGVTFAFLIVAVYVILQTTILPQFDEQEERSTHRNLQQAVASIGERLDSLDRVTSDWAKWDDLYAFVAGRNPGFVATNVVDETFRNVRLNVMLFVRTSGEVVEAQGFDLAAGQRVPVPRSLLAHLQTGSPLRSSADPNVGSKGILMLPEGPLLVSARPIVRSDGRGPVRGTVIWGRFLDFQALKNVADKTQLSLTLYHPDEPGVPPEVAAAWKALAGGTPAVVRPLNATSIAGYTRLADIYGRPALLLRVDEPRVIHAQGQAFARYLVWALLAVVIGGGVVSAVLLERLVLSRVAQLGAAIHDIGARGDLSARVALPGGDELSGLAGAVNGMLVSLAQQIGRVAQLNQITRAIAQRQDLPSIFRVVLARLEDEFPIDFGYVAHQLPAGALTVIAVGPKSRALAAEMGEPEGGTVLAEEAASAIGQGGEPVYVPDTLGQSAPPSVTLGRLGLRSKVVIPLIVEENVFGLLVVARRAIDGFAPAELAFLRTLGQHVALAASQARLYSNLQDAYETLRRSQKAAVRQERLRALGQMASGIAHDINNALAPVVGYADLLLRGELNSRARRQITSIRTAGQDIAHTVTRMREFYRDRGAGDVLLPVELNGLVDQVVDLTQPRWKDMPQVEGRVIRLDTDLRPGLPTIMGIESEIREAVTNLVFNAVDAMPQGGVITLRTGVSDSGVTLEVADTGSGMDEATRQQCLEPFFSTKGERGTGLGLAMVYGVVQRHDAGIEIDTALGRGTTMRLSFPLRQAPAAEAAIDEATVPSLAPLRILCVDDEAQVRDLLRDILVSDGHTVEVADGGLAGLWAFRVARDAERAFDVVITDLGMPHVDGREVARSVKEESPATPVILLTGWGAWVGIEGSHVPHIDARLTKPPRISELHEALARVTGAAMVG
jgi:signal transduction histidine kinase/sensor domain CHASE-containing protein/CheY-like chemotaxis protein